MPAMDMTALRSLKKIYALCNKKGITLILSHVKEQPLHMMEKQVLPMKWEERISAPI